MNKLPVQSKSETFNLLRQHLEQQTAKLSKQAFLQDPTKKRAFVRSLEIIGETVKQIPDPLLQEQIVQTITDLSDNDSLETRVQTKNNFYIPTEV